MTLDHELLKKLGWSDELLAEVTRDLARAQHNPIQLPPMQESRSRLGPASSTCFFVDAEAPITASNGVSIDDSV